MAEANGLKSVSVRQKSGEIRPDGFRQVLWRTGEAKQNALSDVRAA
ncbi:MAG: hypothetical protein HY584_06640 [Candidatus Omnitrophica bacterium]|nr:hypothetical protein [Candidatus Omnitrophota bacterium]